MFWLLCAILTMIIAAAIAAPLWRDRDAEAPSAAAYDLRIYRDQLREVDRDLERNVLSNEEAERLRSEIGRKVLEADRRLAGKGAIRRGGTAWTAIITLAVLLAGGAGLYQYLGAPTTSDLPLSKRLAAAEHSYDTRPSQTEAEAVAPEPAARDVNQDYVDLVARLRKAVAQNPGDAEGLTLLATHEMRLGNIQAAREAQQKLVDLRGSNASGDELMRLAALMMEAAGGIITPQAETVLARALQKKPELPQGRYLFGLLQLQNGRPDRAFPVWRQLLEEGPYDAPWNVPIRSSIRELAWLAGQPDYVPPEPGAQDMPDLPGPDAGAMAAAGDMSPEERQQMIENMVTGLENRLATEGGSPPEWARLIASLATLGQTDRAEAIWSEAQERFGTTPEAIAPIRAAAEQAGLSE